MVDDREKKHEVLTGKVNRLEAEILNIKRGVSPADQNAAKESEAEQRYSKIEAEHRDVTSDFERLQDDIGELSKRLGRLESEFIAAEQKIKDKRLQKEDL